MIPAVPPFFSALRSLPEIFLASAGAKLFVHSRYRSRPAVPTHAVTLQASRSGASSEFPATDFHLPSALYEAFRAYYSPSPRFNWRICYHPPQTVSTTLQAQAYPVWCWERSAAIPSPEQAWLRNRDLRVGIWPGLLPAA